MIDKSVVINQVEKWKKIKISKLFLVLIAVYLFSRLINLLNLPIFNDEAIYIDWAYRMIRITGQLFFSLADAKPPLLMWLIGGMRYLITDPLVAGRLPTVFFGLLAAMGLYQTARKFIGGSAAVWTLILYIITPIFLFFDRQALMETPVMACGIWAFYWASQFIQNRKYRFIFMTGLTLGIGYFIKTTAVVYFLPILIYLILSGLRSAQYRRRYWLSSLLLTLTFLLCLLPLFWQPSFWRTLSSNQRYILSLTEIIHFPIKIWAQNLATLILILIIYLNPLVLVSTLIQFKNNLKQKQHFYRFLSWFVSFGLIFDIVFTRTLNVRYSAPFLPLLLIPAAAYISKFIVKNNKKIFTYIFIFIATSTSLLLSLLLLTKPLTYFNLLDRFPTISQKKDYVTFWSSGWGFDEIKNYLDDLSLNSPIIVGVRADAGIPESAVIAYYQQSNNVLVTYLEGVMIPNIQTYDCLKSPYPVYFVSRDGNFAGLDKFMHEIKKVYKPGSNFYIGLYQLNSDNCQGKSFLLAQ